MSDFGTYFSNLGAFDVQSDAINREIVQLRNMQAEHNRALEAAPKALLSANSLWQRGKYLEALAAFEALRMSPHEEVAADAKAKVEEIHDIKRRMDAAWVDSARYYEEDLDRAIKILKTSAETAAKWGKTEWAERLAAYSKRMADAEASFQALPDPAPSATLEQWLATYKGAPWVPIVAQRLDIAKRMESERSAEIANAKRVWEQARQEGDFAVAWRQSTAIYRRYPDLAKASGCLSHLWLMPPLQGRPSPLKARQRHWQHQMKMASWCGGEIVLLWITTCKF